ncbi:MAG TPA: hypothetical protein VHQ01_06055 [Pyrinomonadaceae bacterium]|nr:hypothetical protein [Pyrinomonadaceae bacterium]
MSSSLKIRTPGDRISYIRSLDLAAAQDMRDLPLTMPLEVSVDAPSASASGGSTVSFVKGFPLLQRSDVLNSTLLAQLAANAAFDREQATVEWYGKYIEVLENVGWVLQGFSFASFYSGSASFTLDKVVLNIIAAIATQNELAVVKATLDALQKSGDNDKPLKILDTEGSSGPAGNFQISGATVDADKNTSMTLGAFYFKATEHRTRFLWWEWRSAEINVYYGAQSVTLNDEVYATVRAAVKEKLGANAAKFIADIKI